MSSLYPHTAGLSASLIISWAISVPSTSIGTQYERLCRESVSYWTQYMICPCPQWFVKNVCQSKIRNQIRNTNFGRTVSTWMLLPPARELRVELFGGSII